AQLGAHVLDPGLRGQGAGGAGVVAGEHRHLDALSGEGADHLGDLGAQLVADADRSRGGAVTVHDHDRHALLLQTRDPIAETPGVGQRGLPTVIRAPSRLPWLPGPACSVTASATGVAGAAAVVAEASGWVLCCSSAAAHASACASVTPSAVSTALTAGSLRVRVPVLSTATWRITPNRSNTAPDVMITPHLLADPIPATTVSGTEIASAHGEAATSTPSARASHRSGTPNSDPMTAARTSRINTPGTSGRAMRSARRARSPFSACAFSTRSTIVVSELSVPAAVVSTSNAPAVLIAPADTVSPGSTSTGIDSPVIAEVSRLDRPVRTMPSVAIRSPGRTSMN